MSKMTKLLKQLEKKPMTYGQMQGFLFKLDDDGSYPREKLAKKNKHPYGYNSTNLSTMQRKNIIAKGEDGFYRVTAHGKKNINKPYAETNSELRNKLNNFSSSYYDMNYKYWILQNESEKLKKENEQLRKLVFQGATSELKKVIDQGQYNSDLLETLLD